MKHATKTETDSGDPDFALDSMYSQAVRVAQEFGWPVPVREEFEPILGRPRYPVSGKKKPCSVLESKPKTSPEAVRKRKLRKRRAIRRTELTRRSGKMNRPAMQNIYRGGLKGGSGFCSTKVLNLD